jgi:hypothetical protein
VATTTVAPHWTPDSIADAAIRLFDAFDFKAWHALFLLALLIAAWAWRGHIKTRK